MSNDPELAGCWWCGRSISKGARHCSACGEDAIVGGPWDLGPQEGLWPAEGENRMLTVMFPDLSGYMAASRQAPGDEARLLVSKVLGTYIDEVGARGGYIARCMHDEVLALFGLPLAHPDDPKRALDAALSIRDAIQGLGLNLKIGINTGLLYFGPVGNERHRELAVVGPAADAAARLVGKGARVAEPGQILVGDACARLAGAHFEFAEPRVFSLKGIAEPTTAHELLGVRAVDDTDSLPPRQPGTSDELTEQDWIDVSVAVDALPRLPRQVLQTAALFGQEVLAPTLARVAGVPENLSECLEPAFRAGLLRASGDRYSFGDARVPRVLVARLLRSRRAILHRAIADALDRDTARAAYHRQQAKLCDEPVAFGDSLRL